MPLYEYKCKSCGEKEEKLEKFEAPIEHNCPLCNTILGMHRQVSLTAFTLAGGGWMAHGYEQKKGSNKKETPTVVTKTTKTVNPSPSTNTTTAKK